MPLRSWNRNRVAFSVKILAVWVLAAMATPVPVVAGIAFDQDFDNGSLNIDQTAVEDADSDQPIITLAFRDVMATGRWYHFDVRGVDGKQPLFRVPTQGGADAAHRDTHRSVYSLDGGETYRYFDNGKRGDGYFTFEADEPFSQNRVRVAYSLPYPVSRTIDHARALSDSPWVTPVPSADACFVIGLSPGTSGGGYRDELGREIPQLPLLGFRITDPAAGEDCKVNVVLTSGTHASESTGNHVLEGKIDFLVGDSPEAAELRRRTVIHVYPQVNPEGRWAGYMRSAPQAPQVNVNRDWTDEPRHSQVRTVSEAIVRDTGGRAAVLIDYHSHRSGYLEIWDGREDGEQRPYFTTLKKAHPRLIFLHWRVNGTVATWAEEQLDTVESFLVEIGFNAGWSIEDYHEYGADNARALLAVIRHIQDGG